MIPLKQAIRSSIGRKLITAVTGLGLVVFTIMHLAGNLFLYSREGVGFNHYAAGIENLGRLLTVAEVGLFIAFALHIVNGIRLKMNHRAARPEGYRTNLRTKGGESLSNASSRTMIWSGLFLLAFVVVHIWQFRLGPGVSEGYVTEEKMRDLFRLVRETFANPLVVAFYVAAMILLGSHLRHGIWSSLQSMGLTTPRNTRYLYCAGALLGVILAVGFLGIPIFLYLTNTGAIPQ